MNTLFESKRLYFREFSEEDAKDLYELNSDPLVIKYTGDPPFESIESARQIVINYDHYRKHGFGRWAAIRKEDNKFIGWCGLKYNEENEIDLGYRFFQDEWGKGYASESARATIKYGNEELGIKEFIGRSANENGASIRVLEKLNFKFIKSSPCDGIEDARYYVLKIN